MTPEWIAVDWGTSRLRAYAMRGGNVIAEVTSDDGMGTLSPDAFEPTLLAQIAPWMSDQTHVLVSGMAGARTGWMEAPYGKVPTRPADQSPVRVPTKDPRLNVHIVPGVSQIAPRPDVMRGEETQIAGFLAQKSDFDGVCCLPGTHTKWAHISAEEIVSFQTSMTGEMFALLSDASVLRHSVGSGWDSRAFLAGVDTTLSRPERLGAELFTLRAADLLTGTDPDETRARLAGLLIGAEIAAAKPYWLGQSVALIGNSELCGHYAQALAAQGVSTTQHEAGAMTRAGLYATYQTLTEATS